MNEEKTTVLTVYIDGTMTLHPEIDVRAMLQVAKAIEDNALDFKPGANGYKADPEPIPEVADAI
jgi:hypothetical protein